MSKLRKDIPCLEVHTVDDGHKTIFYYAGHWWLAYLVTHGEEAKKGTTVYWLNDDRETIYRKTKFTQRLTGKHKVALDIIKEHVSAFMDWFDEFHRKKGPTWKPDF